RRAGQHVALHVGHALARGRFELAPVARTSHGQGLGVEVDPPGLLRGAPARPLAGDGAGPTEVLAQRVREPAPELAVPATHEVHFAGRILDRGFVPVVFAFEV